jgi:two-component system response regulator YesN
MYKIVIADDELIERKALKTIINSNFKDLFEIHEGKNGREAIELNDRIRPHMIIMDIKMPGINGIEAIKEIRRTFKDVYIIIISAYDYFSYVKEAMEYDVRDYLLKPLRRSELVTKLQNAIELLEMQREKKDNETKLKEKLYTLMPILENELCYFIMNRNTKNVICKNALDYLSISFEKGYCMIFSLENIYDSIELVDIGEHELKNKIKNYIKDYIGNYYNSIASSVFTKNIVIFIEVEKECTEKEIVVEAKKAAEKIMLAVKKDFRIDVAISIGNAYSGVDKLWESYDEALMMINNMKGEKIIHIDSFDKQKYSLSLFESGEERFSSHIMHNASSMSGEYPLDTKRQKKLISKAVNYINSNYNYEITMEQVANHVSVSSYYFSKIFKEIIGENYIDYVTKIRMNKAKEILLRTDNTIKEICFEVGYNDPNYFSRAFKKSVGVSPSEFKANINYE